MQAKISQSRASGFSPSSSKPIASHGAPEDFQCLRQFVPYGIPAGPEDIVANIDDWIQFHHELFALSLTRHANIKKYQV
jgi:hypothetical protein